MRRVLVTGASGQLGKSIQDWAPKFPEFQFRFVDRTEMDITNKNQIDICFSEFNPQFCINCAAYTKVDQAELTPEPAYAVNVDGVKNLVEACVKHVVTLIHISTDYVFDGTKEEGYYPEDQPNPINVYGLTKWKGEEVIKEGMQRYFIIRTSWLYSKKYAPNFYLTILEKARRGEDLIVTDAERGCPTDASNLAKHILMLIDSGSKDYGISHFTDGEVMSWYEFAKKILETASITKGVHITPTSNYSSIAQRPFNSCLLPCLTQHP